MYVLKKKGLKGFVSAETVVIYSRPTGKGLQIEASLKKKRSGEFKR